MALTISTGFVVDDAIVMIENIARYLEEGEKPLQAALKGAGEIGFTIISLTVSLIAVLIPLLFMGDVVGRLFREFAVTLAVTIVISAIVSLTLVPSLSALWLKPHDQQKESRFGRWTLEKFDRLITAYDRALQWVLERQKATLLVALATVVLTAALYVVIPKGLFPTQDTGLVQGYTEAGQSVSYARMATLQQQMAKVILQDPDVDNLTSYIGVDGSNTTANIGRFMIKLKDRGHRTASQDKILDRLRERARSVAGMQLFLQPVQDLTIDANVSRTQYQFALQGSDQATVNQWAGKIVDRLNKDPKVRNVGADVQAEGLSTFINIDRDTAARVGVAASTVDDALYDAFGQRIISTIFTESNQYRVILEADPKLISSPQGLNHLYLRSSAGTQTPLASFATIKQQLAPLQVNRVSQFPAANISFDTAPGVSLGEAVS
jgi:multidrug efflux pump